MVDNYLQRDAWFKKMQQLAEFFHLKPAKEVIDTYGHHTGVDVTTLAKEQIQDKNSIDISKFLPKGWNGTRATQTQLMQLILDINEEALVFRDADWEDKLAYYKQQLKTLMTGVSQ